MADQKQGTLRCLVHVSRAVVLALAVPSVVVAVRIPASHQLLASDKANMLMAFALVMQGVGVPWHVCLMHSDKRRPPGDVSLVVLAAVEWVLGCFTYGTASAGLAVALTAIHGGACVPTACTMYLSVAVMAWVAGILGWFSAIGTLWIVAPRFRQ